VIIEFSVYLAATLIVIRRLINRARTVYRWPTRPFGTAPGDPPGETGPVLAALLVEVEPVGGPGDRR
jgi:hypothetical protein